MAASGDRLPGQRDHWLDATWTFFSGKTYAKTSEPPDTYMFAPVNSYTLETFPEVEISSPFLPQPSYFCYLISLLIPNSLPYFL